ncbi:hypothetical protein [Noviherbaspirillum sp. UKPF54]|uniref:hypothetical protein n=1 Tax=Noviherbaspirillum sp. UKPF54 TaxID=2601898 RepID=UPI0011B119EA|nr:hypothetical protein [Noviherbaspirillum sp. UKPF54]QDZ29569.1 hypothetical protein FAY22_17335 [Noviherbaspirillum sp. UKPF54]
MGDEIKEAALKELAEASSINGVLVYGQHGGFGLRVKCGSTDKMLITAKGTARLFGSLDSAMEFLRRMEIFRFEVDASTYKRALLRSPRPDRAEALKQTRTRPTQSQLW